MMSTSLPVPRAPVAVRPLFIVVVCIPLPVVSPQEFVDGAVVPSAGAGGVRITIIARARLSVVVVPHGRVVRPASTRRRTILLAVIVPVLPVVVLFVATGGRPGIPDAPTVFPTVG